MRAVEPLQAGRLNVAGFQIAYEVFGDARARPVLLLPTWQIAPSRHWRMQVPFLSRTFRVMTYDPPGIGGGERTHNPAAFELDRVIEYGIGLLDHLGIATADVIGLSMGSSYGLWMAARHPERVTRLVLIGPVMPEWAFGDDPTFWQRQDRYDGWQKRNAHYWREHYRDWLEFFFSQVCSEPHSTKGIEDFVAWALETTPEILISSVINPALMPKMRRDEVLRRFSCPVLLIHGTDDRIASLEVSRDLAAARPDFTFVTFEGSGHGPHLRDPVRVNLQLADFLGMPRPAPQTWRRAAARRPRRALFVSSPIGLGHIQRDLAIAHELRCLVPDLQIDWLAQHPVTRVLKDAGEAIHPMSAALASESAHWEQAAGEHRLHCFYAWREMDEVLLANFMVFLDVVRATPYDLWIGDEAWDVDYYLHENPELKTAPYVFLTDFLGWLPVDRSPGSREAFLTADYNAEMLEQVARYRRVRDHALYIGDYEDLIPERFGPGLPLIPEWAREHFTAVGYVIPFDPAGYVDTQAVRARLGYDPHQPLVVYAVGGTAVGRSLLLKAMEAWPRIHRQRPEAHCVVVAGPRIDPQALPRHPGMQLCGYVPGLFEHLAVADLAVVQGGLSTTMELAVTRRPFLYFPLRDHCEQLFHVAYRLDRYRAGHRLDYAATSVETLVEHALAALGKTTDHYRPYVPGAAGRAAALIAELL